MSGMFFLGHSVYLNDGMQAILQIITF